MSNTAVPQLMQELIAIMDELRQKCPWDKKQTIESLRQMTLEETYELADAITAADWKGIKEELGDLLLHIVFYAKIGAEQNQFTLQDVIENINKKLVYRHPHIWGNVTVQNDEDVKRNWEQLKLAEGKKSILAGVPKALPALVKAMRIQEKAKQVGFEWETKEQVWDKVEEEKKELQAAVVSGDVTAMEDELGDVLFSYINYARFLNIDAENALSRTNQKFIRRFNLMEEAAARQGTALQHMNLQQMDELWNQIKQTEH